MEVAIVVRQQHLRVHPRGDVLRRLDLERQFDHQGVPPERLVENAVGFDRPGEARDRHLGPGIRPARAQV